MLQKLQIQNYAIIDQLSIDFSNQLNIITGETGAGKSILLGAMRLILGERANLNALRNVKKKCVVEGYFHIEAYELAAFFEENDLDYETITIIRREIAPSGKSRAFVNDTPVSLNILKKLTEQLVNLLAQHQTLYLNDRQFQLKIIDSLANQTEQVASYRTAFRAYQAALQELSDFKAQQQQQTAELDYLGFQIEEIKKAEINDLNEQSTIENELNELNNVDAIKTALSESLQLLQEKESNVLDNLNVVARHMQRLRDFYSTYDELAKRVDSVLLELQDVASEIEAHNERTEHDPQRAQSLQSRLDVFNRLQNKYTCQSLEELKNILDTLIAKREGISNGDSVILELEKKIAQQKSGLEKMARKISAKRKKTIPKIEQKVQEKLQLMGMENARLGIQHLQKETLQSNGFDEIEWQFAANKGSSFVALRKVASGGELSRLMLSIQTILANSIALPTLIFDEIDTGISGEVAKKVGRVLKELATSHQLICITHLPQIASCATQHYYVYKEDVGEQTISSVRLLNDEEHVYEVGQMIDGKPPGTTALKAAHDLVNEMER